MIFAVYFEDNEEFKHMRPLHMEAHLAFLKKNADQIYAAGPLTDTANQMPAGGLWLVQAETSTQVRSIVESDPFWPTGLRKSVRILEWKQVFSTVQWPETSATHG